MHKPCHGAPHPDDQRGPLCAKVCTDVTCGSVLVLGWDTLVHSDCVASGETSL